VSVAACAFETELQAVLDLCLVFRLDEDAGHYRPRSIMHVQIRILLRNYFFLSYPYVKSFAGWRTRDGGSRTMLAFF
jgi:hypothetical protein